MANMRASNCSLQLHRIHTVYHFTRDEHPLGCIVFSFDYKVNNTVYQNVIILERPSVQS